MPATSTNDGPARSARRGCGSGATDDRAALSHLRAGVPPRPVVARAVYCLLPVLAPHRPGAACLTPPLPDLRAAGARLPPCPMPGVLPVPLADRARAARPAVVVPVAAGGARWTGRESLM